MGFQRPSMTAILVLLIGFQQRPIAQVSQIPSFESAIRPVLEARCVACHSGQTPQAQLNLQTKSAILTGGKSGRAIVVGSSEKSLLVEKVVSGSMPPAGDKMTAAEIALVRLWIDKGAPSDGEVNQSAAKKAPGAVTENEVMPIFQMRGTVCHGKRKQEGGGDLGTPASRRAG